MHRLATLHWQSLPPGVRVRAAILLNQAAAPGLGSWLMRHYWAGAGQLVLALAGLAMVGAWFVGLTGAAWRSLRSGEPMEPEALQLGWLARGFACFGVAWLWSGVTSLQIWWRWRQERKACTNVGPSVAADPKAAPRLEPDSNRI